MYPMLAPASLAMIFDENSIINPGNLALMVPIVTMLTFFGYLSIATWNHSKRRERESFYKNDTLKRIAESPDGGAAALEFLREEQRQKEHRRREGLKIGGLVNGFVGVALLVLLPFIHMGLSFDRAIQLIGLVPLAVGAALLTYVYWLAPKGDGGARQQ